MAYPSLDRFYEKGKAKGYGHEYAWKYATKRFINCLYEANDMEIDNATQNLYVDEGFEKFEEMTYRGSSWQEAWTRIANGLRNLITYQIEEQEEEEKRERDRERQRERERERERVRQKSRTSRCRQTRDAFDYDDMTSALPRSGTRHEEKFRWERYEDGKETRRSRAQREDPHQESRSSARPSPPQPAPRQSRHTVQPENASKYEYTYTRVYDPYDTRGGNRHYRPTPPRPAGVGRQPFPEPVYTDGHHQYYYTREPEHVQDQHCAHEYQSYVHPDFRQAQPDIRHGSYFQPPPPVYRQSSHSWTPPPPQNPKPRFKTYKPENDSGYGSSSHFHSYSEYDGKSYGPRDAANARAPAICFYDVLGVASSASADEIKTAFRKLSMRHHPDRVGPGDKAAATDRMSDINQANDVLSDPERREHYDRTGTSMTG